MSPTAEAILRKNKSGDESTLVDLRRVAGEPVRALEAARSAHGAIRAQVADVKRQKEALPPREQMTWTELRRHEELSVELELLAPRLASAENAIREEAQRVKAEREAIGRSAIEAALRRTYAAAIAFMAVNDELRQTVEAAYALQPTEARGMRPSGLHLPEFVSVDGQESRVTRWAHFIRQEFGGFDVTG